MLNSVAYDKIKSVDARTVDELTRHSRLDVSRDASFGAFGLDVTTDLVRSVTGTTDREGLAGRLTGSDSLALNSKLDVPEFPALVGTLLDAYVEDTYKEHFDFIDHLRPGRAQRSLFPRTPASSTSHPVVGELSLSFNRFDLAADHGLTIFTYAAEPGSRSEDALTPRQLAATAEQAESARATDQAEPDRDTEPP